MHAEVIQLELQYQDPTGRYGGLYSLRFVVALENFSPVLI